EADRTAPRKQRHTAHRIWQRIVTELPPERKVAEVSVRRYVRERKHQLGWSTRTVCVPQSYQPGQEGQVDWYEAWAELAGEPTLLQVFTLRSMASGAAFHRAYHRATQQAFLEAHEHAFEYFQGVFTLLRYDNLRSAVKRSCAVISARRPHASSRSARIGAFRASSVRPTRPTKKAASKARPASFGATTGSRCRKRAISMTSTHNCSPLAAQMNGAGSPDRASRSGRC